MAIPNKKLIFHDLQLSTETIKTSRLKYAILKRTCGSFEHSECSSCYRDPGTACRRTNDSVQLARMLSGAHFLGLKQTEIEPAHPAASNNVDMCVRIYTSTLQYAFVK